LIARSPAAIAGVAAVVALAAAASGCARTFPVLVEPDKRIPAPALQDIIESDVPLLPYADAGVALGFVMPVPLTRANLELASVRAVPSTGLTPEALRPRKGGEVLTRKGLYIGVLDLSDARTGIYYIESVRDPRLMIVESSTQQGIDGRLVTLREGVLATRVPYVPQSEIVVFEVDRNGDVADVLIQIPAGRSPPRKRTTSNTLRPNRR